jgi:hypothetical protein
LFIPDPDPDFLLILGPEVKKAQDPGSGIRIRNTACIHSDVKLNDIFIQCCVHPDPVALASLCGFRIQTLNFKVTLS